MDSTQGHTPPGNLFADAAALQQRYRNILQRMVGNLPKPTALEIVRKHYRDRHSGEDMPDDVAMDQYLAYFAPTAEK